MKNFILVLLLILAGNAFACECFQPSVQIGYTEAENVFIGKVMGVSDGYSKSGEPLLLYNVALIHTYKLGDDRKDDHYTFYAERGDGNCHYEFKLGETYLIYTDKSSGVLFHTTICTRTKLLPLVQKDELNQLEQLRLLFLTKNLGSLPLESVSIGSKTTISKNGKEISPDQAVDELLIEVITLSIVIIMLLIIILILTIFLIKTKRQLKTSIKPNTSPK